MRKARPCLWGKSPTVQRLWRRSSEDVFKQNMKIEWIKMQIDGCKRLVRKDDVVSMK